MFELDAKLFVLHAPKSFSFLNNTNKNNEFKRITHFFSMDYALQRQVNYEYIFIHNLKTSKFVIDYPLGHLLGWDDTWSGVKQRHIDLLETSSSRSYHCIDLFTTPSPTAALSKPTLRCCLWACNKLRQLYSLILSLIRKLSLWVPISVLVKRFLLFFEQSLNHSCLWEEFAGRFLATA